MKKKNNRIIIQNKNIIKLNNTDKYKKCRMKI